MIEGCIVNGTSYSLEEVRLKIIRLFQDDVVIANGGFLFKSSISERLLHLGIIPVLKNGERGRHYDIVLACEDDTAFTGAVNTDLSITLMLTTPPKNKEAVTPALRTRIKQAYIDTAEAYLACGFPTNTKFDWISRKMLEELEVFTTVPDDLSSLCSA